MYQRSSVPPPTSPGDPSSSQDPQWIPRIWALPAAGLCLALLIAVGWWFRKRKGRSCPPDPATQEPRPPALDSAEGPQEPPEIPAHLVLCPYCAAMTSADTTCCRGCGRNPFSADSAGANLSLSLEELQRKAAGLYAQGFLLDALEVHRFATRRYPNHKESWTGLLNAPNAGAPERSEARRKLDHLQRTVYG